MHFTAWQCAQCKISKRLDNSEMNHMETIFARFEFNSSPPSAAYMWWCTYWAPSHYLNMTCFWKQCQWCFNSLPIKYWLDKCIYWLGIDLVITCNVICDKTLVKLGLTQSRYRAKQNSDRIQYNPDFFIQDNASDVIVYKGVVTKMCTHNDSFL